MTRSCINDLLRAESGDQTDWYEASATDDNGAEYLVIWRIRADYDSNCGDESDACDWSEPAEIIRLDDGANVTDSVQIAW